MKKLMMIAAMMVAAVSANAQFEAGTFSIQPKLGGIISTMSNIPSYKLPAGIELDNQVTGGALLGGEFEYQVSDRFSLAAGVNYQLQGSGWQDADITYGNNKLKTRDVKIEMGYVTIPLVANVYLFKGFAIKAGAQVGFLTNAEAKGDWETTEDGHTTKTSESQDIMDHCKKVDFSIPVGISYQVPTVPIVIDARYNIGLTDIFKESNNNDKNSKHSVFSLTVGYKFAL